MTDWPSRKTNTFSGHLHRAPNSAEGSFALTVVGGPSSRLLAGRLHLQVVDNPTLQLSPALWIYRAKSTP